MGQLQSRRRGRVVPVPAQRSVEKKRSPPNFRKRPSNSAQAPGLLCTCGSVEQRSWFGSLFVTRFSNATSRQAARMSRAIQVRLVAVRVRGYSLRLASRVITSLVCLRVGSAVFRLMRIYMSVHYLDQRSERRRGQTGLFSSWYLRSRVLRNDKKE